MIQFTKEVLVKVTLKKSEVALIKKQIEGNVVNACNYADIHYNTLQKALSGSAIKREQREKLLEFCEIIKKEKAT